MLVGCDDPSRSESGVSIAPSTQATTTDVSTSMPTVHLVPKDQGEAFMRDHFIVHDSPMVVPAGDVVLSVGSMSGTDLAPGLVDRVDLVVEMGGEQQRIGAEEVSGGWSATVDVGERGLRYRFELLTEQGTIAVPADHTFVNLYAAAEGTVDMSDDLGDEGGHLAPSGVQVFPAGSGGGELGRSPVRPAGSEGLDTGPGGIVALADGRLALFDPWNARVLVVGPNGATTTVDLDGSEGSLRGDPPYRGFNFTADGQVAYMDRTTVYTVGDVRRSFVAADTAGVNDVVGDLEVHGNRIVARRLSGEYEVVGTLDGSEPVGALDGLPHTLILNELFDKGVFFFVPGSPVGHLTFGDTELIPVAGASRLTRDGDAVLVLAGATDGSVIVVHVSAGGDVGAMRLVDEAGALFRPSSEFDGLPAFSVAPDGSSLSSLSCTTTACTLRTFNLLQV